MDEQKPPSQDRRRLVAAVGLSTAAVLMHTLPQLEGTVLRGYRDPIGIVTACTGHTKTAVLGRPYTSEECEALLLSDLVQHEEGVAKCVPLEMLTPGQRAAAISFTFNVGTGAFCKSLFAYKLRAASPTACAELSRWVYADRQKLPGLVARRQVERDMCEGKTA